MGAQEFYEAINNRQLQLGWSTTELERISGIDRSTIRRLKNGKRPPLPGTVRKLADAVGMDRTEALQVAGLLEAEAPSGAAPLDISKPYIGVLNHYAAGWQLAIVRVNEEGERTALRLGAEVDWDSAEEMVKGLVEIFGAQYAGDICKSHFLPYPHSKSGEMNPDS